MAVGMFTENASGCHPCWPRFDAAATRLPGTDDQASRCCRACGTKIRFARIVTRLVGLTTLTGAVTFTTWGLAKEMMMRQHEQGWDFTDKLVCANCVDDDALKAAVRAAEKTDHTCDFCGHGPAAPLDTLLEAFANGLKNEYRDADDEGVSWDGREGGYQWARTWDTYDLVADFGDVLIGEGLLGTVQDAMHEVTWVEKNFAERRRDVVLNESWNRFCEAVKYETRYMLSLRKDHDEKQMLGAGEVPPALILDEVGRLIEQLDVLRTLPEGYQLWRARTHDASGIPPTAAELGTAPREHSKQANRMSPAGISMFYGAEDLATAIQEVAIRTNDDWVTAGLFETSKVSTVVDFTALPPVPSMFDPEWGWHAPFPAIPAPVP